MTPDKLLRLLSTAVLIEVALLVTAVSAAGAAGAPNLVWSTATPTTAPPYLAYAAGAYDPATRTFVMFGGISADGVMSGATWVWNGHDWSEFSGGPSPRDLSSVGFDPQLDQFVLFGGQTAQGTLLNDTWAWNGLSWYQITSSVPAPTPRDGATMAYDRNGRLVLFGGTGYATPNGTPPVGAGGGVAPAETTLGDTWLWQGSTGGWTLARTPGPTPRSGAVAAYDAQNGTTVLFGGESSPASASGQPQLLGDTWIWNGKAWSQPTPATSPAARFAAVADYSQPLGGPMLTGGYGATGDFSDSWRWQGSNWVRVAQRGPDPARQGAAGAYVTAVGQFVVFGGTSGGNALDVTSVATVVTAAPPPTSTTTLPATASTTLPPKSPKSTTTTLRSGSHSTTSSTTPANLPKPPAGSTPAGRGPVLTTAGRVARGAHLALEGSGFTPGATIALTLHSTATPLGTVQAGPDGRFRATVVVPAEATTGAHELSAAGPTPAGQVLTAWANVNVYAPANGLSSKAKTFLLGLSLLVPVVTYAVMLVYGLWRDRRRPGPAVTPAASRPGS